MGKEASTFSFSDFTKCEKRLFWNMYTVFVDKYLET